MKPPPQNTSTDSGLDSFHRSVVQFARLLRDAQRNPERGALFHFINLRHFRATMPMCLTDFENGTWLLDNLCSRFCCRTLLEILSYLAPTESAMVVEYAEEQFTKFLDLLDQNSATHSYTFMGCDGLLIFRIGAELLCNPLFHRLGSRKPRTQSVSQKCLRLLVTIAERFSSVRCLREILEQLVLLLTLESHHFHAEWLNLERRIGSSEIPTPKRVQGLIYSLHISTFGSHVSG